MRADDFFSAAQRLPVEGLDRIVGGRGLVVVAPHPDDESLGCGGLIAEACSRGLVVELVVLSDGVGSHPNSRSYPPDRLRDLREAETLSAAAVLGLPASAVTFLRLPDRHVPVHGAEAESAIAIIAAAAGSCAAAAVLVTWAHDPHCDHLAAATLVEMARPRLGDARLYAYPIWGWALPPDTEVGGPPRGLRLAVSHHLGAKTAAIAAHRSQTTALIDDDPSGFRLSEDMIANFVGPYEILLEMKRGAA